MRQRILEAANKSSRYFSQVLSSKRPRLMYVGGWLGYNNLGDEALFEAYKKLFNGYSLLHYPHVGRRVLSIPTKLFRIAKAAILAGGTLINKGSCPDSVQECLDIFPKFYVFGTGVANPAFWARIQGWTDNLMQWKTVLQRCAYVGVRGPLSAELLINIGIDNVEVIGDPAVVFASDNFDNSDSYMPNSIGLNVGWDNVAQWGEPQKIYTEYVRLATIARKAGWKIRWFVVWPPDLTITKELAKASNTKVELYEIYSNPYNYIDLVKSLSTFVGTRLHSVVLATCAYVPSVMLEYRPKCKDYMMSIGQETNTIRTDKFKAEDVWDIVKTWNIERTKVSQELYRSIKVLRDKQRVKAKELMKEMISS